MYYATLVPVVLDTCELGPTDGVQSNAGNEMSTVPAPGERYDPNRPMCGSPQRLPVVAN